MWIRHYISDIINSNWRDIGVNDPLENHTINIDYPLVEFAPLDLIIDCAGTIALALFVVWFLVTFIKNFRAGYRERPAAPLSSSKATMPQEEWDRVMDKLKAAWK